MASQFVNIIGFGSLLSEKSAKSTMPNLRNFRFAKLNGYRRVFAHPANIFVKYGIAKFDTKEFASLSIEPDQTANPFIVSVFEIPINELNSFYQREDEFAFKQETVELINTSNIKHNNKRSLQLLDDLINTFESKQIEGILCVRSTDNDYIKRWGQEKFDSEWKSVGFNTIWHWNDEVIYPCRVYLRHCLLSIGKQGDFALNDFMNNTFLSDRKTSIKQYMEKNPDIYDELVPIALQYRYNG